MISDNFAFSSQVNTLNQEVSKLAKDLHDIMYFLHSHMPHYTIPIPTYSCPVPVVPSPSVTAASDWQPHVPLNTATGTHLHHETISHPTRNVWGCSGMPSQGNPTMLHSSSLMSSCLHLRCSDGEAATAHRLQSQCGAFQPSRTTPNSPGLPRDHAQRGLSLLGLSSAFCRFPVVCQALQVNCNASVPSMSNSLPVCSPVYTVHSLPSLSVQTSSDLTHNQTHSLTPSHSSLTLSGPSQIHTAFSSFTPYLGLSPSVCTGQTQGQQDSVSATWQNDTVGAGHCTQDHACSLQGQDTDRECRALRVDNVDFQTSTPVTDIQSSHLGNWGIPIPH